MEQETPCVDSKLLEDTVHAFVLPASSQIGLVPLAMSLTVIFGDSLVLVTPSLLPVVLQAHTTVPVSQTRLSGGQTFNFCVPSAKCSRHSARAERDE